MPNYRQSPFHAEMVVGINSRELKALVAAGYLLDFRKSGLACTRE